MSERKYTKQHEWLQQEEDGEAGSIGIVGISEHAQEQLGDVVFVELPDIGSVLEAGAAMAVVESNKAASDVYAPVGGEVVAVNTELEAHPEYINESAEARGWMVKLRLKSAADADALMSEEEYRQFLASEAGTH